MGALPDSGEGASNDQEFDAAKVRQSLPDMEYVVSLFRAMGDTTRLSILYLLWRRPWCVHELATILESSTSNVSHHLRLLRAMRLVRTERAGQRIVYTLDDDHVRALMIQAFGHAAHT